MVLRSRGRSFSTGGDVAGFHRHRDSLADYADRTVGRLNRVILGLIRIEATVVGAGLSEFELLREEGQSGEVIMEAVDEATGRALDVAILNLRTRLSGMATIAGVASVNVVSRASRERIIASPPAGRSGAWRAPATSPSRRAAPRRPCRSLPRLSWRH